ncbi:MAG: hypothetical protein IPJ41_06975 [Phycisphaerales bacterium]|nr:hypothetical protein [Phycisphaerales bacterium]
MQFAESIDLAEVLGDAPAAASPGAEAAWGVLLGLIEQQATQLAALARAGRPASELAAAYHTIRRCFEHEASGLSPRD